MDCPRLRSARLTDTGEGSFVVCVPDAQGAVDMERRRRQLLPYLTEANQEEIGPLVKGPTICVRKDTSLETVVDLLLEHDLSGLPVVDEDGGPIGFVSKTDLLRDLRDRGDTEEAVREGDDEDGMHQTVLARRLASELMTPAVFWLDESAPLSRAMALMVYEKISSLVVVDENRRVVGVLTAHDALRRMAEASGYVLGTR